MTHTQHDQSSVRAAHLLPPTSSGLLHVSLHRPCHATTMLSSACVLTNPAYRLSHLRCSDMNQLQQQQGQDTDDQVDWQQHPEHAGAIVVHHETILKLKRILLTYM